MSESGLLLVGLVMVVGLIGVVVPVLPGTALIWGAALVWALLDQAAGTARWLVLTVVTALFLLGTGAKYLLPGRRLTASGAPRTTLLAGVIGAIVGFFVIPVLGLLIGGIAGVLVAELGRLHDFPLAWASTRGVLVAVGIGLLVELAAGVAMVVTWLFAVAGRVS